jgi:hypothetical protein
MKKSLLVLLIFLGSIVYFLQEHGAPSQSGSTPASRSTGAPATDLLARAFAEHRSNVRVMAEGVVVKMLADDTRGSRHQRFLLELPSGQTVLIAHNIDLATRVDALRAGDRVSLAGEYEWNERGGVIHWTHRDPRGNHAAGWIQHQGRTYQ